MKSLLAQEESMVPALFSNLRRSLTPLMDTTIYETIHGVMQMIEEKNPKSRGGGNKKRTIAEVEEDDEMVVI